MTRVTYIYIYIYIYFFLHNFKWRRESNLCEEKKWRQWRHKMVLVNGIVNQSAKLWCGMVISRSSILKAWLMGVPGTSHPGQQKASRTIQRAHDVQNKHPGRQKVSWTIQGVHVYFNRKGEWSPSAYFYSPSPQVSWLFVQLPDLLPSQSFRCGRLPIN
jgi:hypothetical protein